MMLAHLLIKNQSISVLLFAVQGLLTQDVLEKAIAGVHLNQLR
jgi:hypothetical protein